MASARGTNEGNRTSVRDTSHLEASRDLQQSEDEDSRSILVSNIPEGVNRDKLEIHFMRTSNGGGEIESITTVTETQAKITYQDSTVVESVLGRPQVLRGVEVRVEKWSPPKADTEVVDTAAGKNRSILVSNIPEGVNRDKLEIHFMRTSNGGGEIESITTVTETQVKITYLDGAVLETVLREQHTLNGTQITVQEWPDTEVFDEVDATVGPEIARLVPESEIGKIKKETGIKWEKGLVDDVITVKGTFRQVEDAQQLLQEWLKQDSEQQMAATNDVTTIAHKNSEETSENRLIPESAAEKTKVMTGKIRVTALGDERPDGLDMEEKMAQINPPGKSSLKQEKASEDGGSCKEERQRDGEEMTENTPMIIPSVQNAIDGPQGDKRLDGAQSGKRTKEDNSEGASFQEENPRQWQVEQDPLGESEDDRGHPQQTGEQEENTATSSPGPGFEEATSTADGKQTASRAAIEETSSEESATKLDDMGTSTAADKPEEMETEEVEAPDFAKVTSGPLSDDDEAMPSDEDEAHTQTNSGSPEELTEGSYSNLPDCADVGQVPGDQNNTERDPRGGGSHSGQDEDQQTKIHSDCATPDSSVTVQQHNDSKVKEVSKATNEKKKAFYTEKVDQKPSASSAGDEIPKAKFEEKKGVKTKDSPGNSGSKPEEYLPLEVPVDPEILTYIRHMHHAEISDIGNRCKAVFHTSDDNTKAWFTPSDSQGKKPEPEEAIDEFITLYQQVFNEIMCENMDVGQYNLAPTFLLNGLRTVRQLHPQVLTKGNDDDTTVMFLGDLQKIREARAALCGLLGIPVHRGSRGKANKPPADTEPLEGKADAPNGAEGGENSPVVLFAHTFGKGVEVKVAYGSITTLKVDVIVNAADARLRHGGGVAKAIVQAGGYIIQTESTEKMKKRGFLKPTETEITGAGQLPCKHVIHAHGPKWQESSAKQCTQELKQTCINILQAAEGLKAESVAIPAISSGKYGMPKQICAEALLSGVMEYISTKHAPSCHLKTIWFIDMAEETVQVLAKVFALEISMLKSASGPGNAKRKAAVGQMGGSNTCKSQVSNPPQKKTYASAAAAGTNKERSSPASGPAHRNDSSQVAALIAPGTQQVTNNQSSSQRVASGAAGGADRGTTGTVAGDKTSGQPNTGKDKTDTQCPICLSLPTKPKSLPCKDQGCKAVFCKKCLDKALKTKSCCPVCSTIEGKLIGNQPEGHMKVSYNRQINLPGYKTGTIIIDYVFKDGKQGPEHPNPGKPYTGTTRKAYLPYNADGRKVIQLLHQAFDQKLIFTIGTSSTTGRSDTVVWNDIHHKTRTCGGPAMHGYPDPGYLKRVTEELAAKGIK